MNQDITDVTPKGEEVKKQVLAMDGQSTRSPSAAKLGMLLAAMEATVGASGAASPFKFPKFKMGNKYAPRVSREKRAEIAEFNARLDEQKRLRKEAKRQKALQDFNKPVLTKAEQEKSYQETPTGKDQCKPNNQMLIPKTSNHCPMKN